MAELSPEEQLHLDIMSADRAVPGQSLTNDPDSPLPFEQAPQFTDLATAIDYTFVEITEPETFHNMLDAMRNGMPVLNLAERITFEGFQEGLWNPDLMLQLIEPIAYMLMTFADKANFVPIISLDEEPDEEEELNNLENLIETLKRDFVPGNIPKEIKEKVAELEIPKEPEQRSLLAPDVISEEE